MSLRREMLQFLPQYLESGNASTILHALEHSFGPLSLSELKELSSTVGLVIVFLCSDLAASNIRMKLALAAQVREHNIAVFEGYSEGGYLVLLAGICCSHVIHRIIETTFRTASLIPNLHSLAYSASIPGNYVALLKALEQVVAQDLSSDFFPQTRPPGGRVEDDATAFQDDAGSTGQDRRHKRRYPCKEAPSDIERGLDEVCRPALLC
jgi:hypothetical protein